MQFQVESSDILSLDILNTSLIHIVITLTGITSTFLILLISVFGILQRMPLSDRTPGWCQHIWPMSQFRSARVVTQNHLSNRLWCANTIIIHYGDDKLYFLKKLIFIWKMCICVAKCARFNMCVNIYIHLKKYFAYASWHLKVLLFLFVGNDQYYFRLFKQNVDSFRTCICSKGTSKVNDSL